MIALACALGCEGAGGSASTSGPSDDGTSTGSTTTDGGTTFDGATPCTASADCSEGVCVAPYDPAAGQGAAGMGAPACVPSCVPEDALALWCIDDASCCEGLTCSASDGFCVGTAGTTGDSTVGETWMVESSSDSGSSSETSSDSGSSSGSSSSSTGGR